MLSIGEGRESLVLLVYVKRKKKKEKEIIELF